MRKKNDSTSGSFDQMPLVLIDGLERVIAAFDVNVGLCGAKKIDGIASRKNSHGINGLQGGDDQRTIVFGIERTARTFQITNRGIAVHSH